MTSNNIYNNNAKFLKLKSDNYFSPYCHKKKNTKTNFHITNTEKNLPDYHARIKTNININSSTNNVNITKINLQSQNNKKINKNTNYYLSEFSNKKQKIIENQIKETQSYKKANSKIRIIKSDISSKIDNKNNKSNILCNSMAQLNYNSNLQSQDILNKNKIKYNNHIYKNNSKKKIELDNNSYNQVPLKQQSNRGGESEILNKTHTKSFFDYKNLNININNDNKEGIYLLTSGNSDYHNEITPLNTNYQKEYIKKQISNHNRNISNCDSESYLLKTEYMSSSTNNRLINNNLNINSNIYRNVSNNINNNKGYPTIILKSKPMVTKENTTTITNMSNNESKGKKDSIMTEVTFYKNDSMKTIEELHFMYVTTIQNGKKMELLLENNIKS